MSEIVLKIEGLSKKYRLGTIGHGTLYKDLQSWWARIRGKEDPNARLNFSQFPKKMELENTADEEQFWALRNVSFEVQRGEILGLIGRNGAGKSTILKIISQITTPTNGLIKIKGKIASLLEVGTGFHPELTGKENVYLNGSILGMSKKEINKKFDEIVNFSGVEKFIDTPVKRYSSGMYVRLAFAVAAHLDPDILLIDEVLAVGDASFQKKCLGRMGEVASEGRTVLFVSHDMTAINRLCTDALLLDNGQVVQRGKAIEVTSAYLRNMIGLEGSKFWDLKTAPGNNELKLISVILMNEQENQVSMIEIHKTYKLKIKYYVGKPNLQFRCAALFYTQGVCAFASFEPTEEIRPGIGNYCSTVVIPPNLLSEGEYSIGISIFTSYGIKHRYVQIMNAIVFQVNDPMTAPSSRGDYTQNLAGVVRPLLNWHFSYE